MIINVSPSNIEEAAEIYSISWIESHKDICSERFLKEHTPSYMKRKIEDAIENGWKYYIYLSHLPTGTVSFRGNEISALYVLPNMERKGIGGELLSFVENKIESSPFLWCRKENYKAMTFYLKRGYVIAEEKVVGGKMTEVKLIKRQSHSRRKELVN